MRLNLITQLLVYEALSYTPLYVCVALVLALRLYEGIKAPLRVNMHGVPSRRIKALLSRIQALLRVNMPGVPSVASRQC
jgi:hypothetical protein